MTALDRALSTMPLIAILRGVAPEDVVAVGEVVYDAGFRVLEVPLTSPDACASIALLARRFGDQALVGAGTVTAVEQLAQISGAGGRLVVMPHADTRIVRAAKQAGLVCVPGIATPTEAFASIEAGADALKLFPAEANPPPVLRALRAVLPPAVKVLPVGSISAAAMRGYHEAGASGFGIGSALYRPGRHIEEIAAAAANFVEAARRLGS